MRIALIGDVGLFGCNNIHNPIPAGVLQWEEIAKDIEEFAEIRLVWDKVK